MKYWRRAQLGKLTVLFIFILNGFMLPHIHAAQAVFTFNRYAINQGLANPYILETVQDRQGFIWAASQDGLHRFDGYQFKSFKYNPDDPSSLPANYVQHLHIDSQGTLWVSTWHGGFAQYDPNTETFKRYQHDPNTLNSLSNNEVFNLIEDSRGNLWIATLGGGLNHYDRGNDRFIHYRHDPEDPTSLSDDYVYAILEDQHGDIWVGTRDGGLNRLDMKTGLFKRYQHQPDSNKSLSHNKVYSLNEDQAGNLWVGTRGGGLNRYNRQTDDFAHYRHDPNDPSSLSSDQVWSIFSDKSDNLWVGTFDAGLNRLRSDNRKFNRYRHDPIDNQSLSNDKVLSINQDQIGNIWLGTFGGGLNSFDPASERFGHIRHQSNNPNTITPGSIHGLLKTADGITWIGTEYGLNRYNPTTRQFSQLLHDPNNPNSLSNNHIWALIEDHDGQLWIGTDPGGLNRYNPITKQFSHYNHSDSDPNSLSDDRVWAVHQNIKGEIWIGTTNGLNRYNRETDNFTTFHHNQDDPTSLSHNSINVLYTDRDGTLWIGTNGGGLNRFDDKNQKFIRYPHLPDDPNSISNSRIKAIHQDNLGHLWLGTEGGLNRFDYQSQTFDHPFNLNESNIRGILQGHDNQLWIGGESLQLFDPQKNQVTFSTNVCSIGQGAYYKAHDGQLLFGNVSGYCAFYPQHVIRQSTAPRVVFTDFRLVNQSVAISSQQQPTVLKRVVNQTDTITLSHLDNILSFEFAAIHFTAPRQNQFQYQLEGFHDQWIDTGIDNRRATFTNLPAGNYRFKVRAANHKGIWSKHPRSIELIIKPAPWHTWWAYTLYAMVIIIFLVGIVTGFAAVQRKVILHQRSVNIKLKQLDRLKDEFLANTSHELRTPLNGIIGLAESLMDGVAGPQSKVGLSNLSMIVSSGKRLANLVNDILDFSQLKNHNLNLIVRPVDLHSLTEVVLTLSKPLIGHKSLTLVNNIPTTLPAAEADENRLQQILHNLIGNAIKFTNSGEIKVNASAENDQLTISVSDTGIGIAKEKFAAIFGSFEQLNGDSIREYSGTGLGLSVSKQLVELHGGQIWLNSQIGQGSTFYFTLPQATQSAAPICNQTLSKLHSIDEDGIKPVLPLHHNNKLRILLVDDEPVNRQVLLNHLTVQNYQLVEAADGEHALDLITHSEPFDLILLDIMMPKLSGYDVCRRLRERHALQDLPIIFLTAKNQLADMVESFAVGANDYLSKPVSKHELLTRVETHLKFLDIHRNLESKVNERTAELLRSNQQITTLSDICAEISANLDINQILHTVYQRIKALMPVDVFGIGIFQPELQRISFKLALEAGRYLPEYYYNLNETHRPGVWCVNHKQPLIMNDYLKDYQALFNTPVPQPTIGKQAGAIMYWPLMVGEKIIGVLTVQSFNKNTYDEHQQKTIQTLASTTAIALDNANAYKAIAEKNSEILATQQQLVQAEKMASLGTLTAGVAHEINNPTNFLQVSHSNLQDELQQFQQFLIQLAGGKDGDQSVLASFEQRFTAMHEHLFTIKHGTDRIKAIVKDLRVFSQLDAAEQQNTKITELLQSTLNLVKSQFSATIEFTTEFKLLPQYNCYPAQLNQLFMNLIINACDAIESRQKHHPGKGQIHISCQQTEQQIQIDIKDNGCGIEQQEQSKIFEPFYTTKEIGQGTGLGLSIAYSIVQQHQGELSLNSQPDQGTTFTIKLPLP